MCARYGIEFSQNKLRINVGGRVVELPFREVIGHEIQPYGLFSRVKRMNISFWIGLRSEVRPTNRMWVVRLDSDSPELAEMSWGFLPKWMKPGRPVINARDDKLQSSTLWKDAFESRRCLIPATCFYEWQVIPGQKRKAKMMIQPLDQWLFYFAGLWGTFHDKSGKDIDCCTIITTKPNELMRPIHNRMPVILEEASQGRWLEGEKLDDLLKPYEGPMVAHPSE